MAKIEVLNNFEGVIEKAKLSCFNSGHRLEDHFVDVTEMIEIGKGGQRPVNTVLLSRYACYLAIQNADPKKEIVAQGQTYFAIQTRRQELGDERIEDDPGIGRHNAGGFAGGRKHQEDREPRTEANRQHRCAGEEKETVTVVDIFGNDTMTIIEVAVGGKK